MLDYNYHMTFKVLKNRIFRRENVKISASFTKCYNVGRYYYYYWFIDFLAWRYITPTLTCPALSMSTVVSFYVNMGLSTKERR